MRAFYGGVRRDLYHSVFEEDGGSISMDTVSDERIIFMMRYPPDCSPTR